ncbi:uncharacterized protein [Dysidea avara]|uniref:uncharacterized protein isoform X2 n=1 Tax=Dysidea avara TaxID=196820 RepID=UPI00332F9B15
MSSAFHIQQEATEVERKLNNSINEWRIVLKLFKTTEERELNDVAVTTQGSCVVGSGYLTFAPVANGDQDFYMCVAMNIVGFAESSITLTVYGMELTGCSTPSQYVNHFQYGYRFFFNCFHPDNPWNDDVPFSVPPHLQDQYDTFEELQGRGATVPTNQNAAAIASVWGTSISKAETDNLLSDLQSGEAWR